MEPKDADDMKESVLEEVLFIQNEAAVFEEASNELQKITQTFYMDKNFDNRSNDSLTTTAIENSVFQKQIKTGEITPFQAIEKNATNSKNAGTFSKPSELLDVEKYLLQQADLARKKKLLKKSKLVNQIVSQIPVKRKKLKTSAAVENINVCTLKSTESSKSCTETNTIKIDQEFDLRDANATVANSCNTLICSLSQTTHDSNNSGSEYVPSDEDISDNEIKVVAKKKNISSKMKSIRVKKIMDDGNEKMYRHRVKNSRFNKSESFHKLDNLFKVPHSIWKKLYKYQRVSVQWLWELHSRSLGGLLGDEMGLGKTVQVIAFLASLDFSDLLSDGDRFRGLGPTLVICPATLLEQWVKHFHDWWPTFRVVLLHQSSTYQGEPKSLVESLQCGGILVTSYTGVLNHKDVLLKTMWHYVILDEGHKIRNPEAKITQTVKKFSTPHRLLLTGSPMQNSLKELWSLFDFILPGKLGTMVAFMEHCATPITRGGYTNATPLQEATALQVATMLKDAITPYMLRRTKFDVQHHVNLPEKNEQILFCSLTEEQKKLYKQFLQSDDVSFVLNEKSESGRYRARLLVALTSLRKICNHPDLYLYTNQDSDDELDITNEFMKKFGYWKRSGKMTVVRTLLKIWKKQGHRALLFTQSRQMMHILESLLQREEHTYLRMDGTTPMTQRQQIIFKFNTDSSYFIFLSTTRVGGLGVNLTGADRVIIYDPDWNPATDAQARERAWRIGQDKNVTIYRLITAGTIEEKMYHRQIFKILLSNRVLEDPRQRRLFQTSDLTELFNLNEPTKGSASESDKLFHNSRLNPMQPRFSRDKIEAMRKLASSLSKTIGMNSTRKDINKKEITERTKTDNCSAKRNSELNQFKQSSEDQHDKGAKGKGAENERLISDDCNVFNSKVDFVHNNNIKDENENQKKENQIRENDNVIQEKQENAKNNIPIEDSISHKIVSCDLESKISTSTKDVKQNHLSKQECKLSCKQYKLHQKKKQKTHETSALFEGERVSCLIGRRLGNLSPEEPAFSTDDQYVLSKLFSKSTVSSAFQHDSVLSGGKNNNETTPLERIAHGVAQEGMESVRKSRKWCWMPTWNKT